MIKPYMCLKRQPTSIEELQRLADDQYEQMAAEHSRARMEKDELVEQIDAILTAKRSDMYEQLMEIAVSDFFRNIQKYDEELTTFARVLSIYEKEWETEKTSLLTKVTSVAELQEVYVRTVFGMRRLELGMPKECQNEFIQLIVQYDMSAIYLANVRKWHGFYHNNNLSKQLTALLYETGRGDL